MTQVELSAVRKQFGGYVAIDEIDLDVASGELVALLGPSGCGKTTTLRMIAGLERPTAGEIRFDGKDVSEVPVQDRNVGMVFQRYALFPHMTVERNVAFGLSVRGLPKAEIEARLDEMLEVVQLQAFRTRFPAQLSGGQMQRVAIARTLITKPSVLMMDEPLANLDTALRGEMRRFIRALQQRFGITTIFVTHDQVEAMELADRVAVIFNGRLAQYDTPERIYRRPASLEVAHFMGAANIFPGRLVARDRIETDLGLLECTPLAGMDVGATVHAMLRGEALEMTTEPPPAGRQAIRGKIASRDFFGASVTYGVRCGSQQVTVTENARRMVDVGAEVWLDIAPEHVWLIRT
ncbi:ATP-binding cassette domain-containing protein [bacterium]|nr:ATP-binding cassette domain-containing protein [bacterium]